jgi:acetyl esterase/lipase
MVESDALTRFTRSRAAVIVFALLLAAAGCGRKDPGPEPSPQPDPRLESIVNITYCTGGGAPLLLDVYFPQTGAGPWPVIVFIHGGRLLSGNKNAPPGSPADMWRQSVLPAGYVFVSIDYRLGPVNKFPTMIEDAKCAIRFLRANAALYSIDPNRIGVTGPSSGGYLAALVALAGPGAGLEGNGGHAGVSSAVHAAVIEYGADMDLRQPNFSALEEDARTQVYPQPLPPAIVFAGTVVNHVSANDPPFLIFHGDRDTLVDPQDSIDLDNALRAAGIESRFQAVTNGGHGWSTVTPFGPIQPSWTQILQMEREFFDRHLKR